MTRLIEIQSARQGFDRNRDWLIYFKDEAFRRGLFDFYLELSVTCYDAQGVENLATNSQFEQYVRDQRVQLTGKFHDLASKGRTILGRVDAR